MTHLWTCSSYIEDAIYGAKMNTQACSKENISRFLWSFPVSQFYRYLTFDLFIQDPSSNFFKLYWRRIYGAKMNTQACSKEKISCFLCEGRRTDGMTDTDYFYSPLAIFLLGTKKYLLRLDKCQNRRKLQCWKNTNPIHLCVAFKSCSDTTT